MKREALARPSEPDFFYVRSKRIFFEKDNQLSDN